MFSELGVEWDGRSLELKNTQINVVPLQTIYMNLIRFFKSKFSSDSSLKLWGSNIFSGGQRLFGGGGGRNAPFVSPP